MTAAVPQFTARQLAHALLDDRPVRTIDGRRYSGFWWITTTGSLAYQDVNGATHHVALFEPVHVRWGEAR